jgi:hypothetical protein
MRKASMIVVLRELFSATITLSLFGKATVSVLAHRHAQSFFVLDTPFRSRGNESDFLRLTRVFATLLVVCALQFHRGLSGIADGYSRVSDFAEYSIK